MINEKHKMPLDIVSDVCNLASATGITATIIGSDSDKKTIQIITATCRQPYARDFCHFSTPFNAFYGQLCPVMSRNSPKWESELYG